MPDAILFDLDGVLVDSGASVRRLWRRWAEGRGLDPVEVEASAQGRRVQEVVAHWAPELHPEVEDARLTAGQVEDTDDVVAMPGATELLASLAGRPWAVVTSGARAVALARLWRAGLPVPEVLVSAGDVAEGKPAPDGYLRAAAALGVPIALCLVVEDAPVGIEAGVAAGAQVAAVATTFAPDALARAHVRLGSLAEVAELL